MLDSFARAFLAFGPAAVIVAAAFLTNVLASATTGPRRLVALLLAPIVTLAVIGVLIRVASALTAEGSGFLLGGVTIAIFVLASTFVYYPIVLIAAWRSRRRDDI